MYNSTTAQRFKNQIIPFLLLFFLLLIIISSQTSCKKINDDVSLVTSIPSDSGMSGRNPDINCDLSLTTCEDCDLQNLNDENSDDQQTVLGDIYNNPYSLINMTTAFNYIYSTNIPLISTTHFYVRFKPNSVFQLNTLDSLDLELFDYPLNRFIVQEGDFWPQAYVGLSESETPWLYTVVKNNFVFPDGIQKEILESLHIPDDNEVLEDEAYYITGNNACDSNIYNALRSQRKEFYRLTPIDPCEMGGIDGCGGGGGGGGTLPSTQKPKGQIKFKTYVTNVAARGVGASAPLKYARIVGKRFLKIDKTYTDENGNFQLSKRFPKKVTIIVKFKASTGHGQHSVRVNYLNSGIWRSMFPLKKNIGTYKGNNLANLNYEFQKGSTSIKRKTKQWLAAVIMNTTEESRLFISENNLQQLPDDLRLYLYAPQEMHVDLPQYDFLRRSNVPYTNQDRELFSDIVNFTFGSLMASASVAVAVLSGGVGGIALSSSFMFLSFTAIPHMPDILFYYKTSDINSLTASKVSICAGQQLGVASLFHLSDISTVSGGSSVSRDTYMEAVESVLLSHPFDTYAPFGNNVPNPYYGYQPGVISIYQSYAQHFGHTIADRIYGTGAGDFELQGKQWTSDINKSSNQKYLEEFSPNIGPPTDYFNWIPVGLINDLIDTGEPANTFVNDNVSGFTYQDIQSVLYNKPTEMGQFKTLLQSLKPSQSVQINQLFASYGY